MGDSVVLPKADHNTITPFGVKVCQKYKVLSKREHGVIKMQGCADSSLKKVLFDQYDTYSLLIYILTKNNRVYKEVWVRETHKEKDKDKDTLYFTSVV